MATPWLTAVAVTMPDEIDLANAETVCQKLCSAMTPGIDLVIADFTMTAFCDARGVRAITRARRYSAESGSFEHRAIAIQLRNLEEMPPGGGMVHRAHSTCPSLRRQRFSKLIHIGSDHD